MQSVVVSFRVSASVYDALVRLGGGDPATRTRQTKDGAVARGAHELLRRAEAAGVFKHGAPDQDATDPAFG